MSLEQGFGYVGSATREHHRRLPKQPYGKPIRALEMDRPSGLSALVQIELLLETARSFSSASGFSHY